MVDIIVQSSRLDPAAQPLMTVWFMNMTAVMRIWTDRAAHAQKFCAIPQRHLRRRLAVSCCFSAMGKPLPGVPI
jgi:hypothetical protein